MRLICRRNKISYSLKLFLNLILCELLGTDQYTPLTKNIWTLSKYNKKMVNIIEKNFSVVETLKTFFRSYEPYRLNLNL